MIRSWIRYPIVCCAVVAGIGLLWFLLGPFATWIGGSDLARLTPHERLTALSGIRTLLGSVLSAVVVGGGLYYTGRKFFLDRDKQFTDRFNAAIEHLGSPEETVRAGGVRALDRILHDSPADRNRVLESITGFLRHRTAPGAAVNQDDVTAALAVLRNRGPVKKRGVADTPLDLRKLRAGEANLRGLVLSEADLSGAELAGAVLAGARLDGARLRQTTLIGTDLSNADLRGADLTGARLATADLTSADLRGAIMTGAHLTGAILDGADLRGADLADSRGLAEEQLAVAITAPGS